MYCVCVIIIVRVLLYKGSTVIGLHCCGLPAIPVYVYCLDVICKSVKCFLAKLNK